MSTATATQPDNRPASSFVSQKDFANAAFAELNRRIAPAQLADSAANGVHLTEWLRQNVQGAPQTVDELAELLEQAVRAIVHERKLTWTEEPKVLTGPNTVPATRRSAQDEQEAFTKQRQQAEAKAKYDAEQSAAEKRIVARINSYSPTKLGMPDYARQEKFQEHWRAELAKGKKNGSDLRKLEKEMGQ